MLLFGHFRSESSGRHLTVPFKKGRKAAFIFKPQQEADLLDAVLSIRQKPFCTLDFGGNDIFGKRFPGFCLENAA